MSMVGPSEYPEVTTHECHGSSEYAYSKRVFSQVDLIKVIYLIFLGYTRIREGVFVESESPLVITTLEYFFFLLGTSKGFVGTLSLSKHEECVPTLVRAGDQIRIWPQSICKWERSHSPDQI